MEGSIHRPRLFDLHPYADARRIARGGPHTSIQYGRNDGPKQIGKFEAGVLKTTVPARERAKKIGVDVKQVFLTSGKFDLLIISETANGDNIAKLALMGGAEGNVRSRTIRAWTEAEMTKLISELP